MAAWYNEKGGTLARVYWSDGRPPAECVANARLIAAAPDLLAALKAVIADIDLEQGADVAPDVEAMVRAAIAKATGQPR